MAGDEKYRINLPGQEIDEALRMIANRVPEGYALGTIDGVEVGPESEFYHRNAKYYAELAGSVGSFFIVNYNGISADKTFAEILDAYESKKEVVCFFNDKAFLLSSCDENGAFFSRSVILEAKFSLEGLNVTSNDSWEETSATALSALTQNVTLYVDAENGDDANDGSQALPYKTIHGAINSLPKFLGSYKATIKVKPGSYTENFLTISGFVGGNGPSAGIEIVKDGFAGQVVAITGYVQVYECNCFVALNGLRIIPRYGSISFRGGALYMNAVEIVPSSASSLAGLDIFDQLNGVGSQAMVESCKFNNLAVGVRASSGMVSVYNSRFTDVTTAMEADGGIITQQYNTFTNVDTPFSGPMLVEFTDPNDDGNIEII